MFQCPSLDIKNLGLQSIFFATYCGIRNLLNTVILDFLISKVVVVPTPTSTPEHAQENLM